jgi:DNA-binding winged helix-turn-helix (wHTH) protein/TolB-like protein
MPALWTFGLFELDPVALELRRQGRIVKLQPQPCRVLALLVERAGDVVTRDELRAHVWGQATFVDFERGLNYAVAQIRTALGDSAETPRFIETLPRRGYRFIAPVASRVPPATAPVAASSRLAASRRTMALLGAGVLVGVGLGLAAWVSRSAPGRPAAVVLAVMPFIDLTDGAVPAPWMRGLTEDTVARLAALDPARLAVIGNAPILRRGGAEPEIPAIGRELGAAYVVLGRVRSEGDRARCTVHLIRVSDFAHLWTGTYDRRPSEGLDAQRDIAGDIARQVGRRLIGA